MQILGAAGTSNTNSRLSTTGGFSGTDAQSTRRAPHSSNEMSQANSAMSIECGGDQMTSTIDLKVDVHRKNSSESSDSLAEQCSGGIDVESSGKKSSHLSSSVQTQNAEVCQTVDYRHKSMKTKSKSEDASTTATAKSPDGIGSDLMTRSEERRDKFVHMDNSASSRNESHKRRMRWKLQRQTSLDSNEMNMSMSSRLQRHRSSDSNDERRRHHRSHHHGMFNPAGSVLQSMPSEMMDLEEDFATKSELAVASFPSDSADQIIAETTRKSADFLVVPTKMWSGSNKNRNNAIRRRAGGAAGSGSGGIVGGSGGNSKSTTFPTPLQHQRKNSPHSVLPLPSKCLIRNQHSVAAGAAKMGNSDPFFRMFHLKEGPVDDGKNCYYLL